MDMHTNQIHLRSVMHSDASTILKWENNPEFWPITEHAGPFEMADIENFISKSIRINDSGQKRYMIFLDQTAIGAIDIFNYDVKHHSAGIGILIAESEHRNKGYAKAALRQLLEELKNHTQLVLLHCIIYKENESSIGLFKSIGFKEVGFEMFRNKEVIRFNLAL